MQGYCELKCENVTKDRIMIDASLNSHGKYYLIPFSQMR